MQSNDALLALGAGVLGILCGAWLARAWRRMRERRRARAYNERGQRAEQKARELLASEGYAIVSRQLRTTYTVTVDGAVREIPLVVDYVVERRGERFAAEVKTGASAIGLDHSETRRQLLEYQLALGLRRGLLVDADTGRVSVVTFPIPTPNAPRRARLSLIATGAVAALLLVAASVWLLTR